MDTYSAYITLIFLILFTLVLWQKMKIGLKRESFDHTKKYFEGKSINKE